MTDWTEGSFQHTVVGVVSFHVRPDQVDAWREKWQGVARQAESTEGCRYFRLAVNTREDEGMAIITAWNPGSAWLAFIQSVPAPKEMQAAIGSSQFSFYVVMEEGEEAPW